MGDFSDDMTIDELSEIYRVEKKSRGLSSVRPDLFTAMAKLVKNLRKEYDESLRNNPDHPMCEGLNIRRKKSLQLSRDIIDIRMQKIMQLVLRATKDGHNNLDALTVEEREYYEGVLSYSKAHIMTLDRIGGSIRYVSPDIAEVGKPKPAPKEIIPIPQAEEPVEEYYEPEDDIPVPVEEVAAVPATPVPVAQESPEDLPADIPLDLVPEHGEFDLEEEPEMDIPDDELDMIVPGESKKDDAEKEESQFIAVRILSDVGKFAGLHGTYDLKEKQVVNLPKMFADILINNGLAAKINCLP